MLLLAPTAMACPRLPFSLHMHCCCAHGLCVLPQRVPACQLLTWQTRKVVNQRCKLVRPCSARLGAPATSTSVG
jgi:hypothetical protein